MAVREEGKPLRVAVIGVGHLGKEHARVYSGLPGVELAAVSDVDEEQARKVAKKCSTEFVRDYRELLGRVDAVSVVVPTVLHHEVAKPFLERGIHVLVEKPMTRTLDQGRELAAVAAANKAVLQVGHIERFNPVMKAVDKLSIKPLFLECHRLAPYTFRSGDVGVVMDLMIHDIDIVLSLVRSPVKSIEAVGVPVVSEKREDIANARLTFENGCVANITASRVSIKKMRKIRVFGPDSYISLDYLERKCVIYKKSPELNKHLENVKFSAAGLLQLRNMDFQDLLTVEHLKIDEYEPLAAELAAFVESARSHTNPIVGGEEGIRAISVAEEILRKIRSNLNSADVPFEVEI
ncbi:MAG TPA: Gfo/Idh/MocA family oxidoreductase [Candidatus Brocadiia bacterium]|nr:Gfo/Idh/MocA family oxidoreductase [Candidatus Brocadiia bacterium]